MLESRLNDNKLTNEPESLTDSSAITPQFTHDDYLNGKAVIASAKKPSSSPVNSVEFYAHHHPIVPHKPIALGAAKSFDNPINDQNTHLPKLTTNFDTAQVVPPLPPTAAPPVLHSETVNFIVSNDLIYPPQSLSPINLNISPPLAPKSASPRRPYNNHLNTSQTDKNTTSDTVVFRQKGSELTPSHARDRRSFVDRDQQGSNNTNRVTSTHVTADIASDLSDGKHPVCCFCNAKIMR